MRFMFETLGCRLNEAEVSGWRRQVRAAGHSVVADINSAEVVVFNSCAVTAKAARTSRKTTRGFIRQNPNVRVVITGCFSSLEADVASALDGVDLVVGNEEKGDLVSLALRELGGLEMPKHAMEPDAQFFVDDRKTRGFIKVQDGCRHQCTYCIVTEARGGERSRTVESVVLECQNMVEAGFKELVLSGVHIGGYGSDIGESLPSLVAAVLSDVDVKRLRLGSMEPWAVDSELLRLFEDSRMMPHMHLPLQSGSDAVLRRMARRCTRESYGEMISIARSIVPDLNVTTDIIVGFPGETEADHAQTLEAIELLRFGDVHTFSFSSRAGTPASRLPGHLPKEIIRTRSKELSNVVDRLRDDSAIRLSGQVRPVLFESRSTSNPRCWSGLTDTFHRVEVEIERDSVVRGEIIPVLLTSEIRKGVIKAIFN